MGAGGVAGGAGCACLLACPLGQVVQGAGLPVVFRGAFPAFRPLSCFACLGLLANMALFRVLRAFLARFVAFVWVCVACVLCLACGALYA